MLGSGEEPDCSKEQVHNGSSLGAARRCFWQCYRRDVRRIDPESSGGRGQILEGGCAVRSRAVHGINSYDRHYSSVIRATFSGEPAVAKTRAPMWRAI